MGIGPQTLFSARSGAARWKWAEEVLEREGVVVPGHRAMVRRHPLVTVARQSLEILKAFAAEFGLTPSSRSRISLPESDDGDELGGLLD